MQYINIGEEANFVICFKVKNLLFERLVQLNKHANFLLLYIHARAAMSARSDDALCRFVHNCIFFKYDFYIMYLIYIFIFTINTFFNDVLCSRKLTDLTYFIN